MTMATGSNARQRAVCGGVRVAHCASGTERFRSVDLTKAFDIRYIFMQIRPVIMQLGLGVDYGCKFCLKASLVSLITGCFVCCYSYTLYVFFMFFYL